MRPGKREQTFATMAVLSLRLRKPQNDFEARRGTPRSVRGSRSPAVHGSSLFPHALRALNSIPTICANAGIVLAMPTKFLPIADDWAGCSGIAHSKGKCQSAEIASASDTATSARSQPPAAMMTIGLFQLLPCLPRDLGLRLRAALKVAAPFLRQRGSTGTRNAVYAVRDSNEFIHLSMYKQVRNDTQHHSHGARPLRIDSRRQYCSQEAFAARLLRRDGIRQD